MTRFRVLDICAEVAFALELETVFRLCVAKRWLGTTTSKYLQGVRVDVVEETGAVFGEHVARVPDLMGLEALLVKASLAQRADAIVVLGSGRERGDPAWGADQPTGVGLERQRYAARLAKASGLPVLTTGGLHYGTPPSEAQLMAVSMEQDFGVAVRWKEERSRTTWENAQMSAEILLPQGIKRVVVVTQAWHMPRSVWSFEKAGFSVVPAPVGFLGVDNARPLGGWMPEFKSIWQSGQLINEAVGQVGYRLFYR